MMGHMLHLRLLGGMDGETELGKSLQAVYDKKKSSSKFSGWCAKGDT